MKQRASEQLTLSDHSVALHVGIPPVRIRPFRCCRDVDEMKEERGYRWQVDVAIEKKNCLIAGWLNVSVVRAVALHWINKTNCKQWRKIN